MNVSVSRTKYDVISEGTRGLDYNHKVGEMGLLYEYIHSKYIFDRSQRIC